MFSTRASQKQIGKLHFDDDAFFGRNFELSQLVSSYQRLIEEKPADRIPNENKNDNPGMSLRSSFSTMTGNGCEIVLLGGYAGVGKSSLVKALQTEIKKIDHEHCFIRGKLEDNMSATEPYWALIDAFSTWVEQIDESERNALREPIQEAVGKEGKVLTDLIPSLTEVIGQQPELQEATDSMSVINRTQLLFLNFIKVIARKEKPLVLFLDDLHWADEVTLDLLSLVITNPSVEHLMLVASYRDNEVICAECALTKALIEVRRRGKAFLTLTLGNLTLEDCSQLIASALQIRSAQTVQDLSKALLERTNGNPFHVQESLILLERKNILTYSFQSCQWVYKISEVSEALSITDNVVFILLEDLKSMSSVLQTILGISSFLMSSFRLEVIFEIANRVLDTIHLEEIVSLLESAVQRGFLENAIGSPWYKFRHDRVKEAAKLLLSEQDSHIISLTAGTFLLEQLENGPLVPISKSESLFLATDLFNRSPLRLVCDYINIARLVELNVEAADSSCQVGAYLVALKNLNKGVELMDHIEDGWVHHFDLCLKLYTLASLVEFTVGDFGIGKDYYDEVKRNARTFSERYPSQKAYSDGLGQRERHEDALEIDKNVLKEVGQKALSVNAFSVLMQLSKLKKKLNMATDDEILSLPVTNNEDHTIAVETLSMMSTRAFYCDQIFLSLMSTIRGLTLILKHGVTKASSYIFAGFGNICCMALGDFKLGNRMIKLAEEICAKTDAKAYEGKIIFTTTNYVKSWFVPLPKLIDRYHQGYQAAIACGDIEFACLNFLGYVTYQTASGLSLDTALKDCGELDGIINHYQVQAVAAIFYPLRDFLLVLAGEKLFTHDFTGFPKKTMTDKSKTMRLLQSAFFGMQTAFYLGETNVASRLREEVDKYKHLDINFVTTSTIGLVTSLIATEMFRQTGDRKQLLIAKRTVRQTKKTLTKKGNEKGMNLLHKYKIMEADYYSTVHGKLDQRQTKEKFDEAISNAKRAGFLQDAAIANELCGEFFHRLGDDFWPEVYLTKAHDLYSEWGAKGKVNQLITRRNSIVKSTSEKRLRICGVRTPKAGLARTSIERMGSVANFSSLKGSMVQGGSVNSTSTSSLKSPGFRGESVDSTSVISLKSRISRASNESCAQIRSSQSVSETSTITSLTDLREQRDSVRVSSEMTVTR